MPDTSFLERTRIIIGEEGIEKLTRAHVALYGLGGVGAACAIDLVRAGVGCLRCHRFRYR